MKVGVKIWPENADYAYEIAGHADFIEIMAKRGEDFSFLDGIDMPFVVHAEHGLLGINYADPAKAGLNRESMNFAIGLADKLEARTIIVHPGYLEGTPGERLENAINFLRDVSDKRMLLENLILREKIKDRMLEYPFSTPEKMGELLSATDRGMCLDLSHAQITASFLGLNYIELLEKFMELKPKHFHACGGIEGRTEDMHLHLWEGNLNIRAFKRMLPKTAWVTLETPCELEGQLRDIELMRG
jgi:deoxyribonuclease-4